MLEHMKNDMNDDILKSACDYIDKNISEVEYVGGFENFLYSFEDKMLRLSHSDHRKTEQILAEIEFIDYLSKYGVSVNTPIKLNTGRFVEKIEFGDKYFSVCCFEKVEGKQLRRDEFTDEIIYNYGKSIGKIHKLTKDYKPKHKRHEWHDDNYLNDHLIKFKEKDVIIVETLNMIIEDIKKIKPTRDNYGLIHTDLHRGNFFVKDNQLNMFDFDDSCYMYFMSDIAIVLFYQFVFNVDNYEQSEIEHFYDVFMEGYNSENVLPSEEFYKMKLFLELRRIDMYAICVSSFTDDNRPDWATKYINEQKEKIYERDHVVKLDFHR